MKETELVTTADGSHTLRLVGTDEHYHSVYGAVTEALHIYIHAGLDFIVSGGKQKIGLFEVGYGTGLNALLTAIWAEEHGVEVMYTAVDAHPVDEGILKMLNYGEEGENRDAARGIWPQLCNAKWNHTSRISKFFSLQLLHEPVEFVDLSNQHFDVVFFDAFAPAVTPGMWSEEIFQKIAAAMKEVSVLVTYATSGVVKRAIAAAGLEIEKIPGPPGKREMLRAVPKLTKPKSFNVRVYGVLIYNECVLITDEFRLGICMTKFPGGGLKFGEGTVDCLKREVREEIGQEAKNIQHYYTTDFFQQTKKLRPGQQLISIYYRFDIDHPDAIPVKEKIMDIPLNDGAQSFRWVPLQQLNAEMFTFPIDKKVAEMIKND